MRLGEGGMEAGKDTQGPLRKEAVRAMQRLGREYPELSGFYPNPKGLLNPPVILIPKVTVCRKVRLYVPGKLRPDLLPGVIISLRIVDRLVFLFFQIFLHIFFCDSCAFFFTPCFECG